MLHPSVDLRSSRLSTLTLLPQINDTICSDAVNIIFSPLQKYEGNNKSFETKRISAEFQNSYFSLIILTAALGCEARKTHHFLSM